MLVGQGSTFNAVCCTHELLQIHDACAVISPGSHMRASCD